MLGVGAKMKDFGRVMVVCNMRHSINHNGTAKESFLYGKTCATLPLTDNLTSAIITVPSCDSYNLCNLCEEHFCREVEHLVGGCLGSMELVSKRSLYPLVGAYSNRFAGKRFALISDAAVGMHPGNCTWL